MSIAIKVENLSKAYQLGEIGTGTISRDLERWFAKKRGKEDPFLKIGEENDRTAKGTSNVVWSLKDVSFEINQGDAVGIIGRNGAGKSTLLKLLSRVTAPTAGSIRAKGRIASLLEVGTGFHPELTGKENIYLNGAILGMRKKEISRKFDEIVHFAGVERYIDTPVKRYSSGMYVRLAFAVAAHLESEILIVDEVLAVGDAEFQKKCLGKMGEVSKGEGRTVLFVSHQMNSVAALCTSSILMKNGKIEMFDTTKKVINHYLIENVNSRSIWENTTNKFTNPHFTLNKLMVIDQLNKFVEDGLFQGFEEVGVLLDFNISELHRALCIGIAILNSERELLFWSYHTDHRQEDWTPLTKGRNVLKVWVPNHLLNQGEYYIKPLVSLHHINWILNAEEDIPEIKFSVIGGLSESPIWTEARPGLLAPILRYEQVELEKEKSLLL